ncbi:MAG: 3-deoxy-7-phosphoheptulonate synthase [Planctomycetes bacterium]|nr:3-deoxy-7-phosphoheptulonate synthase [Planctomycetota bacterium]
MRYQTDDVRIDKLKPLLPPAILMEELPVSERASTIVALARQAVTRILRGEDDRLVVVMGPCSVHDLEAAEEYAGKLKVLAQEVDKDLYIVMRVYFEKPRTTVGWKGLINDPHLDGSFAINEGLRKGRRLLRDLAEMGVPSGCEFLDPITPQFFADLVSWGAIGARTTESQVHRELASGLSVPVGFKNGTDGNLQIAFDAIRAAANAHHFLSVTKEGLAAIVATRGNPDCHVILRGANGGPNYSAEHVTKTVDALVRHGLPARVMIDCSHGNSSKDYKKQPEVATDVAKQIAGGSAAVFGVMLESHLVGGRQDLKPGCPLTYGQSITDACLGWDETVPVVHRLAEAVRHRRVRRS